MRNILGLLALLPCLSLLASAAAEVTSLQIGVKHKPSSCPITSQNGDRLR